MSWIAISDSDANLFDARGLGDGGPAVAKTGGNAGGNAGANATAEARAPAAIAERFLPQGSLVLESRLSPENRPQTLLAYERAHPWPYSFSLQALPGGGLVLVIVHGSNVMHATLNLNAQDRSDTLRVTYSWDAPRRWARLSVERPEHDAVASVELTDPRPPLLDDVARMAGDARWRQMDPDVVFFAVSDQIEPVGPMPSLTHDVPLWCPGGYRRAGQIQRGDLIDTMEAGLVPVLQSITRDVPARGSFRPVRLRAPYFGLQGDIVVSPDQRLVVGGPEVEYIFGREAVLVPARHLVNGVSAMHAMAGETVRYHQLILPHHETVFAAGCPVESLFVGRIRRKNERLAASLLAPFDRGSLPEHAKSSYPMLKPFEAITLLERRAA